MLPEPSGDISTRGRRVTCPHCGMRTIVRGNQIWSTRFGTAPAQVRIISAEKDGAIVEQVGREDIDPRWGLSYRDLLADYRKD